MAWFLRRGSGGSVTPIDVLSVIESDPGFRKALPDVLNIKPHVRDVFLWTATVMHEVLSRLGVGDEYGIYNVLVQEALRGNIKASRRLTRFIEVVKLPRCAVLVSINRQVSGVKLLQVSYSLNVLGVFRVLDCARYMDYPFVFIADMRNIYVNPVKVNMQKLEQFSTVPRLPGPRLYINIERCIRCVEEGDEKEVHCTAYVEDDECLPPEDLHLYVREDEQHVGRGYPSTEVIYVEKHVNKSTTPEERRIIVAFAYSLTNMLVDEVNYIAFCNIG